MNDQLVESKQLTPEQYIGQNVELANHYKKEKLLLLLPWVYNEKDPFYCTERGVVRTHCCLSLEFLIKNVLQPGCYWSPMHSLMSKEIEKTNLKNAVLCLKARGDFSNRFFDTQEMNTIEKEIARLEKFRMFLMYRGAFKTTMITIDHTIQELIINPEIRMLIMSGSGDLVDSIIGAIKSHFTDNELFRYYFPEYCPMPNTAGKIEFGTMSEFTLPNRTILACREPTVMGASPGTKLTGFHFNKHKHDDLINEDNVTNEDQLKKAKRLYQLSLNLFDNIANPWVDIIGTIYSELDLYTDLKRQASYKKSYAYTTYNPVTYSLEAREKDIV